MGKEYSSVKIENFNSDNNILPIRFYDTNQNGYKNYLTRIELDNESIEIDSSNIKTIAVKDGYMDITFANAIFVTLDSNSNENDYFNLEFGLDNKYCESDNGEENLQEIKLLVLDRELLNSEKRHKTVEVFNNKDTIYNKKIQYLFEKSRYDNEVKLCKYVFNVRKDNSNKKITLEIIVE